ncbi:uncharacterized protein TNCV_2680301 [Trichonephila clavipes]|uniref:Mutator-like transposase domain-containing protein n=1 Tax=Trichonephila clavipes TaxID=2585209 RepID=A0A8X6S4B7_TRICX|nr:uncharacterized protein TNCV_2680301 [Trichonephila clavipes]
MVKSIARKRKRHFYCNKLTNTSKRNSNSAVPECTASCSKLGNESFSTAEEMPGPVFGNRIVDLELIVEAFAQLCCPKCFAEKVELFEDSRYGLCSHFALKCKCCDFFFAFASSKKIVNAPVINTWLVYGMRQIGKSFAGAFKLCSTLNLPRLTKTAYKNQEAKLLKVVQEVAEESMIKAATEIVEKKQNLSSDIVKCGILVDGTWQRRGYTSMNGCVAAISVDTVKVLDIEVMSSYCPTCKRLQTMPRNLEYESSKADHICQCNFTSSSSKMEIVGASRIFVRSEKNRRLQYTQCYGDGDSKAFMSVKDTYGLNSVTKFECIGHVQKRVGSRLRKLKTKTKGLSGKGKLTDNFIDKLQNYYGIAVRSNVGNLNAMQQNVISALYHCASSDKKPMHGQCPIGKESWCYFQRGMANGTKCSTKYAGLSNDVLNKIKPVYL